MAAGTIAVREYASADEMRRHAREVRERMFAPRPPVVRIGRTWSKPVVREQGILTAKQICGEAGYSIAECFRITAAVCGVTLVEMDDKGRSRRVSKARQIAYWLARHFAKATTWEIGRRFRFDHTTVMHGCKRVESVIALYRIPTHSDPATIAAILWREKWPALKDGAA